MARCSDLASPQDVSEVVQSFFDIIENDAVSEDYEQVEVTERVCVPAPSEPHSHSVVELTDATLELYARSLILQEVEYTSEDALAGRDPGTISTRRARFPDRAAGVVRYADDPRRRWRASRGSPPPSDQS